MQHHQYSAAEMTGDSTFPTHLTAREAQRLLTSHGMRAVLRDDGVLSGFCPAVTKEGDRVEEEQQWKPTADGLFRSARILLWLGY